MWGIALFLFAAVAATYAGHLNETIAIDVAYLHKLFAEGQYEKVADVLGIEDVNVVRRGSGSGEENPMFNKGMEQGDLLLSPKQAEETRQFGHFGNYPDARWTKSVPYVIHDDFSAANKAMIENAIALWNLLVPCIKWKPYTEGDDVVLFFPGTGCWSYIGRIGGVQLLSLEEPGCCYRGTVLHEMNHAIGSFHEQSRADRDFYIKMLWDNIPEEWHAQYNKMDPKVCKIVNGYDYHSCMHYPIRAPGTGKPAFELLEDCDERFVGFRDTLTCADIEKINAMYCGPVCHEDER